MFKKNIVLILFLSLSLTACSSSRGDLHTDAPVKITETEQGKDKPVEEYKGDDSEVSHSNEVKKFDDLDELKDFLSKDVSGSNGLSRGAILGGRMDYAEATTLSMNSESAQPKSISSDYSKTNTQVKNVDEADIVKTDGEYIYTLSKKSLFIVKAYEAKDSKIVSEIKFKSQPSNIYINGDKLVIHGTDYSTFRQYGRFTFLKVFDISDKKTPKQIRDLSFEGNYFDSRMIGDYVYFVTSKRNYRYRDGGILPMMARGEKIVNNCSGGGDCVFPNVYYFDIPYSSYNFTSISAVNIEDDEEAVNSEIYVFSNNQEMYVSLDNIYITYTEHLNQYEVKQELTNEIIYPQLSDKDKTMVNEINLVEDFILNKQEKLNKVSNIVSMHMASLDVQERDELKKEIENKIKQRLEELLDELEKTIIHKIAINDGELKYEVSGEVKGYVLNQFSMDEDDGYFRIATTKNREWSQYLDEDEKESYSNLYILDKNLKVVGSMEEIARGEKIYSVRFMQNRAYMVTFEQIDPLFVIDLADPKNPSILGKLKVPGYSNYLHPYDENILIGLGKDTFVNSYGDMRVKGVKLSMFDVSDVENLKEIDTYVVSKEWSNSIALHDHKAFLFSKDKNLLVIPINVNSEELNSFNDDIEVSPPMSKRFNGVLVFDVNKDGFALRGEINHDEYSPYSNVGFIERSLYIEDMLYTFSDQKMKINKLEDLSFVKDINFLDKECDFEIIN